MSSINITGVDMYGIPTKDADRAKEFYVNVLGLKPDAKADYEVWAGNLCLGIWEPERMGRPFEPNNNGPAFHVDDVEATRKTLEEKGVVFKGETIDTGVCHMALFSDPDGNELMLHHRYDTSR